jgi:hypothetical protein
VPGKPLCKADLLLVTIKVSVQDLVKEIIRTSKERNAVPGGRRVVPGNPDDAASPFPSPATLSGGPVAEAVVTKGVTSPIRKAALWRERESKEQRREIVTS